MGGSAVRVLLGYDGSLAAGAAIGECARLFPAAHVLVAHLWTPPFASEQLRRRLGTSDVPFTERSRLEGRADGRA